MPKNPQVILITGATRGIGRITAIHLAQRGHTVYATGRNQELLDSLAKHAADDSLPMIVKPLDVTDEAACKAVAGDLLHREGRIDALVNNAGYGLWGPMETFSLEEIRLLYETNVFAPLRLSQIVLPSMRELGFGTIVNIGSLAGRVASPAGGAYASSKSALAGWGRAMRLEAASFGVRVVLIEPGVFESDFHSGQAIGERVNDERSPYKRSLERLRIGPDAGGGGHRANPVKVATRIRQVIESRSPMARYTVGVDARFGALATRFLPDRVMDFLIRTALRW